MISIILSSPQLGQNIGAAARVMKNFGLDDLRLITPKEGWPNHKAKMMATDSALDIIDNAKVFDSLGDAVKDIHYLYATSVRRRDMNKDYVTSKDITNDLPQEGRIGILFGRESWGLSNEELNTCHKIITINSQGSLNLAQAICVVCYELSSINVIRHDLKNTQNLCSQADLDHFFHKLINTLDTKSFFRVPEKRNQMIKNVKNIFCRINKLSKNDIQILHGIISCINN